MGNGPYEHSGGGETSYVSYNEVVYKPEDQPSQESGVMDARDGVLNPYNESDTNLYGADGGYNGKSGGTTGGGTGGIMGQNGGDGTFYGAGGGAGSMAISSNTIGGDGYRGYVYLKFT